VRVLFAAVLALTARAQDLPQILSRIGEEAEVYRRAAPQAIAEETLEQRVLSYRHGNRPVWETRRIVSEYSLGALKEAPDSPHEFRQVVSVDGRKLNSPEKARHALSLDLTSADDRVRKRLLEDFQKHGLAAAAVDFGPLILLFTKRQIGDFDFAPQGAAFAGAEAAYVLRYTQKAGPATVMIFEGRKVIRQPLEGLIFVRRRDSLPLRITLRAVRPEHGGLAVDEGTVDYGMTPHGFLAPVSVVHRSFVNGRLAVEDVFHYSVFRRFKADSEIKFTEAPPQP
jgi:hypothetical protein